MARTRNILMIVFWTLLLMSGAVYMCGDYLEMDMSLLAMSGADSDGSSVLGGSPSGIHYYIQMLIILLTLAVVPLALRLFKFRSVDSALKAQPAKALLKWGTLRLLMLESVLFVNTLLYYIYGFEPAYGYLAVMVLLTLPFVYPTMSRCKAETTAASDTDDNSQRGSEEEI